MRVTFYGAAEGVTGSKHLVEIGKYKVLLDCGSFQGRRRLTRELNSKLPFAAEDLTAVILSHGHLDHCGSLPMLLKHGYQGQIFATAATRDITRWMLKDSAHIQLADLQYMRKHHIEGSELAEPLFTIDDVDSTMAKFVAVPYVDNSNQWFEIFPDLRIKLYEAGHILGSAAIVLEGQANGQRARIAFTGDLGRNDAPLLKSPAFIRDQVPVLLMESTYGNRTHEPIAQAKAMLDNVIKATLANRGKIIVPAFALGRTQELVYMLHQISDEGELANMPIYVDSPLALEITTVFKNHREIYDRESWVDFGQFGEVPLSFKNLRLVSSVEESKALNAMPGPLMIISSSGMAEAGRIIHHLINNIGNPKNTILITGFQAAQTVGRRLMDGARAIKLFGKNYSVKAQVVVLHELSAHADQPTLINYAKQIADLQKIFLVHGETSQAQALAQAIRTELPQVQVFVPSLNQTIEL
ncbi:MAG: MBL fold metallo-hydrolase [Patescibacteria group bacterium]